MGDYSRRVSDRLTPEEVAAAWLAKLGMSIDDPPIDVEHLAEEAAGLDIQLHGNLRSLVPDPGPALSGLLLVEQQRVYVDAVEAERSPGRRRFTIAHELGHWHLHRSKADSHYCRPEDIGSSRSELYQLRRLESQANRFAAALLMPESTLRVDAPRLRFSIPALARRFGVSATAMQVRLEVLDLLPTYMRR
jgi:hypothetical protein